MKREILLSHGPKQTDRVEDSRVSRDTEKNSALIIGLAKNIQLSNCSLSYLHLVDLHLDDKVYKSLFESLLMNKSLKTLKINMCNISQDALY